MKARKLPLKHNVRSYILITAGISENCVEIVCCFPQMTWLGLALDRLGSEMLKSLWKNAFHHEVNIILFYV